MSSTKRGAVREKNDFYETPPEAAQPVMDEIAGIWQRAVDTRAVSGSPRILDAGAGMGALTRAARRSFPQAFIVDVEAYPEDLPMERALPLEEAAAYAEALAAPRRWALMKQGTEDIEARLIAAGASTIWFEDYLTYDGNAHPQIVVSNPPFSLAMRFLQHTTWQVRPLITAFLLRLNFLGSEERAPWLEENPPQAIRIITHRPDFTGKGGDSIEYAWMLWGDPGILEGVEPIGWYR